MTSDAPTKSSDCLDQIIAEYLAAEESGNAPPLDDLLAAHPDLADDLRKFFANRDELAAALPGEPPQRQFVPPKVRYFGDYELLDEIARGGMGVVYRAKQTSLNRIVAIKMILSGHLAGEEDVKRFRTEAEAAANLKHPGIVPVHEVGIHDGHHYFSMDYIEGRSLAEIVRENPLPARKAAGYVRSIAEAVHYAHNHQQGTLHRDLKPSNILIDCDEHVHVTDFGLAVRVDGDSELTRTGDVLGTPAYMPPEQAQGKRSLIGPASDVYSLGAILYESLTGRSPFRAESSVETLQQVIEAEPVSPRLLNPKVPRDLETICLKCLQKEPHKRYVTAAELAADLGRWVNGEPITARPIGRLMRTWRWSRRKPAMAAFLATAMALTLTLAIGGPLVALREGVLRSQAETERTRADENAAQLSDERDRLEQVLYYSEMNRAGIASRAPNGVGEVASVLENWRPHSGGVDRRGWEWFYLESLLHQDQGTFQVHDGAVNALDWSPDGSRLATSCGWSVRIWGNDGRKIQELTGHRGLVNSANWSRDGARIVSASADGTIGIWDTARSALLKTMQQEGEVVDAAWNHNDQRLAAACVTESNSGETFSLITIWSTEDWKIESEFSVPGRILNLSWHPRQDHLAVGIRGGARILDPAGGTEEQIIRSTGAGGRVAWSRDGSRLAVGSSSDMIVWDSIRREPVATIQAKFNGSAAWGPGDSSLAVISGEKTVKVFDISTQAEQFVLRGHLNRVTSLSWHPGGDRIATACTDGAVRIWSATAEPQFSAGSRAVSWNADGSQYVSCFRNQVLIGRPGSAEPLMQFEGHVGDVLAASWSPVGSRVASAALDGEVRVWDAVDGELSWSGRGFEPTTSHGPSPLPTVLAWSPDGGRLAFPQTGFAVGIVDAATGNHVQSLSGHTGALRSLAWSPDGAYIVSSGYDRILRVWNLATGQPEKDRHVSVTISALCWSPDGSRIAGATSDNNVYIWDRLPEPPLLRLAGHTTYVHTVAWSPDGERIASADESGMVRIWDADTGEQTLTLKYPRAVPMVAWNRRGDSLACVGFGGSTEVRIWSASVEQTDGNLW